LTVIRQPGRGSETGRQLLVCGRHPSIQLLCLGLLQLEQPARQIAGIIGAKPSPTDTILDE
jgi:hypothetical protein